VPLTHGWTPPRKPIAPTPPSCSPRMFLSFHSRNLRPWYRHCSVLDLRFPSDHSLPPFPRSNGLQLQSLENVVKSPRLPVRCTPRPVHYHTCKATLGMVGVLATPYWRRRTGDVPQCGRWFRVAVRVKNGQYPYAFRFIGSRCHKQKGFHGRQGCNKGNSQTAAVGG